MSSSKRSAFTLVELLAVIAIIGILSGLVLGISGIASKRAAEARVQADMELIKNRLEEYRLEEGAYPDQSGAMDEIAAFDTWTNETSELTFIDPWGKSFQYSRESKFQFTLWSFGPDGQDDTVDDISNYKNKL